LWTSRRAAAPITKAQPREPLQFCWRAVRCWALAYARGGRTTCKVPVTALWRGVPSLSRWSSRRKTGEIFRANGPGLTGPVIFFGNRVLEPLVGSISVGSSRRRGRDEVQASGQSSGRERPRRATEASGEVRARARPAKPLGPRKPGGKRRACECRPSASSSGDCTASRSEREDLLWLLLDRLRCGFLLARLDDRRRWLDSVPRCHRGHRDRLGRQRPQLHGARVRS